MTRRRIVRRIVRRIAAAALAGALAALGCLLLAAPAWAHATLVDSSPAQDDHLAALPEEVSFEFNQDMSAPAYVIVTGPDGTSMTVGEPQVDGPVVRQAVAAGGPEGDYTMAFRAVSEDGHPVTGEITFAVGEGAGSTATADDPTASDAPGTSGSSATSPATQSAPRDDASMSGFLQRHRLELGVAAALFILAALMLAASRRVES